MYHGCPKSFFMLDYFYMEESLTTEKPTGYANELSRKRWIRFPHHLNLKSLLISYLRSSQEPGDGVSITPMERNFKKNV